LVDPSFVVDSFDPLEVEEFKQLGSTVFLEWWRGLAGFGVPGELALWPLEVGTDGVESGFCAGDV
jgi:hypothetical protein